MSSNPSQSRDYLVDLNRKFDSQFSDINVLLDKVIERNSGVYDYGNKHDANISNDYNTVNATTTIQNPQQIKVDGQNLVHQFSFGKVNTKNYSNEDSHIQNGQLSASLSPSVNVKENTSDSYDRGNIQDLVRETGKESELNTSNYAYNTYQGDSFNATPIRNKYAPSLKSTTDAKTLTQSPNEDSYDYQGGLYSTPPKGGFAKQKASPQTNKLDTTHETIFEAGHQEDARHYLEPSTYQGSNHIPEINSNQSTYILDEKTGMKIKVPKKLKNKYTTQLLEENFQQYSRDMDYLNKYTTEEVIRSVEPSKDGNFYLVNSLKKEQVPPRKLSSQQKEDPIDQILVTSYPSKEVQPADKLASIYQQVSEVYTDGTSYTGEKFMGLRQGKGTYYYHEGYRYEGSWEEDQMSGFGILWVNDEIKWYEGEWKNNTFDGKGIIYNLTPEELSPERNYSNDLNQVGNGWIKYEGKFSKGAKDGFGTLFLSNGDTFTGNFVADNVDGRGSYTFEYKKELIAGNWENNILKLSF